MADANAPVRYLSARGFMTFDEVPCRGGKVNVRESSLATEECVWIFLDTPEAHTGVQLNEAQARRVRDALSAFIEGDRIMDPTP